MYSTETVLAKFLVLNNLLPQIMLAYFPQAYLSNPLCLHEHKTIECMVRHYACAPAEVLCQCVFSGVYSSRDC